MRYARTLFTLIAVTLLVGCARSTMPLQAPGPDPLVVANCPKQLPTLQDDSFGATTAMLVELAGIYHKCRAAAVKGSSP